MKLHIVEHLLTEAAKNPVFGDSFDEQVSGRSDWWLRQVEEILEGTVAGLGSAIRLGMPELAAHEISPIVWQIAPKTVCFCPALTAGELDNTRHLTGSAIAIGLMYWADQTMDRGDEAMPVAIELFAGGDPPVPEALAEVVQTRLLALKWIEDEINELARPEDVPFVLACFRDQVLLNEARLHRLSTAYESSDNHARFLEVHADEIAGRMITDAGFPSVASTLYAIYRRSRPELPPLSDVYADPALVDMLQVCNSVVRIADELGDREIDAGYDPAWGVFAINLFNQSHPSLLRAFFEHAGVRDRRQVAALLSAFACSRNGGPGSVQHGEYIMDLFFEHGRGYVRRLAARKHNMHQWYVRICKRVLEIGYVNKMGDILLAGVAES